MIGRQPDMMTVGEAANGHEAVDMWRKHRPDVALVDLRMPMLDSVGAIDEIRGQDASARVIVLTKISSSRLSGAKCVSPCLRCRRSRMVIPYMQWRMRPAAPPASHTMPRFAALSRPAPCQSLRCRSCSNSSAIGPGESTTMKLCRF
jgi:chemotaxis response regulator CheB